MVCQVDNTGIFDLNWKQHNDEDTISIVIDRTLKSTKGACDTVNYSSSKEKSVI